MEVIIVAIGVLILSFGLIFTFQGISKIIQGKNESEYEVRDTKELYDRNRK